MLEPGQPPRWRVGFRPSTSLCLGNRGKVKALQISSLVAMSFNVSGKVQHWSICLNWTRILKAEVGAILLRCSSSDLSSDAAATVLWLRMLAVCDHMWVETKWLWRICLNVAFLLEKPIDYVDIHQTASLPGLSISSPPAVAVVLQCWLKMELLCECLLCWLCLAKSGETISCMQSRKKGIVWVSFLDERNHVKMIQKAKVWGKTKQRLRGSTECSPRGDSSSLSKQRENTLPCQHLSFFACFGSSAEPRKL